MTSILSVGRVVTRSTLGLLAGSTVALTVGEYSGSDSKPVRSFRFWKGMVPIYAHYKYVEWRMRDETDASKVSQAYRPLNERYSPRVKQLALDLKGFYYKLAQVLSTRDDFLPDEYLEWTKQLQDQSPSILPGSEIQRIVEQNLQLNQLDDLFSSWDNTPIGAASVGQVHRATLKETGQPVAVKVQYPGIERKFRNDIETVELFCKYLMPQNIAFFKEIKKQFATEFDMRGEAQNLKQVHENLHAAGWNQLVEIPYPIHSSKQVLVMTLLPGLKLVDGIRAYFTKVARRFGMTPEQFEEKQKEKMQNANHNNDNRIDVKRAAAASRRIEWMLWIRDLTVNSVIFLANYTIRPLFRSRPWEYWQTTTSSKNKTITTTTKTIPSFLNLGQVMDTLIRVHAHEIFTDGAFNGDPHPGNILLMPDGRLGLIDYGQVKRMSISDRIIYAKLMIALSRDDRAEVVRLARNESGYKTKYSDDDVTYRSLAFFHCRDTQDILQGKNVSEFMEWMEKADPVVHINDEFVMVGRVSLLLRGLANAFGMKVKISDYWKEEAEKFLKAQGIEY